MNEKVKKIENILFIIAVVAILGGIIYSQVQKHLEEEVAAKSKIMRELDFGRYAKEGDLQY